MMPKQPKFNPVITRIKLSPEQAVLACGCFSRRQSNYGSTFSSRRNTCMVGTTPKRLGTAAYSTSSAVS